MTLNNRLRALVSALLLTSLFVPGLASAAVSPNDVRGNLLCSQLSTLATNVEQRLGETKSQLDAMRSRRDAMLTKLRGDRQDTLENKKMQADAARQQHIVTLNGLADTDAQKAAVTAFQNAVDQAVNARIASVKTANDVFQKGLDAAIAARKTQADTITRKYADAVKAAIAKAEADCAANQTQATVRSTLTSALQKARTQFMTDRQTIVKIDTTVKTLVDARGRTVQKARQDFVAAIQKAREDLRSAFGLTPSEQP